MRMKMQTEAQHDDALDALGFLLAFSRILERDRLMLLSQQFQSKFWVRAAEAGVGTCWIMAAWVLAIEVIPYRLQGVRIPVGVLFVAAAFVGLGFFLRGILMDRAKKFGGTWDGQFRLRQD